MGYPLRDRNPSNYRMITIRTDEARLWMVPNKDVRKLVGGIIARYQEIFKVEILGFIVLSNHIHILVRALLGNADEFCENVNREIARRINWRNNRRGSFWARRYSDLKVLSEDDLLEAFLYVTTNAVKHGLVEHPSLWPGLNSYSQSITEKAERYVFHHYSAGPEEPQVTEHVLKVSPLPIHAKLTPKKRIQLTKDLIEERTNELIKSRREAGQGFLGVKKVQCQDPSSKPETISRAAAPPAYTKDPGLRREYRQHLTALRLEYSAASARYRLGYLNVVFPEYTFKPPLHRKPRLALFKPLPDDYFKKVA